MGGHSHHRHAAAVDGTDEVGAVHLGHLDVGYQNVIRRRGEHTARLIYAAAHGETPFSAGKAREHLREKLQLKLVVVHDDDVKTAARSHGRLVCGGIPLRLTV